jgi:ADP-ribose pyrophosphatase YjhB (NUDIX family)
MIGLGRRYLLPLLERVHAMMLNALGGKSVGVRALVIGADDRVLLVRHTYRQGWHTPGGGVMNGEAPETALRRELMEEVGLEIVGRPAIFGVYRNNWRGRCDYPILYVVREIRGEPRAADPEEIAEVFWFALDNLPRDCAPKTRDRINEYLSGGPTADVW